MMEKGVALGLVLTAAIVAGACSSEAEGGIRVMGRGSPADEGSSSPVADAGAATSDSLPDPLAGLPRGKDQLDKLCARNRSDAVMRAFCDQGQKPTSIVELQDALGLHFSDRSDKGKNAAGGNPAFAMLGHSSSLVAREVSAINPRAFVFTPPPGQPQRLPGYVVMGFARGDTFVEIAADDPIARRPTFYLLDFQVACEANGACKPGELLTPGVEKGWTGFSLYDEEDLANTIVDCRHCHQPNGPGTRPMLRMQELQDPWTHWFRSDRPGGVALLDDFHRAHGEAEDYAGIPGALIHLADGAAMEDFLVGQGFGQQPNAFDTKRIEQEVQDSASQQPAVNVPPGTSATWQRLYDAAASGDFIPPPYHDVKVTDPDKLAAASDAYKSFVDGKLFATELPDIRNVLLDDALEGMSIVPRKGASGREVLVQACAQCHNPRLDGSLSRAKFDVTELDTMSDDEKREAIARMKLPPTDLKHMPPAMMRVLPQDALDAAIGELEK